jgi:hypothetical protein
MFSLNEGRARFAVKVHISPGPGMTAAMSMSDAMTHHSEALNRSHFTPRIKGLISSRPSTSRPYTLTGTRSDAR